MGVFGFVSEAFRFRKTTLSFLALFTYLAVIFLQELSTVISLTPPAKEPQLLSEAWQHLQVISSSKHPFTSPNNDRLHDYLKDSIIDITANNTFITISSDEETNHTILINQHDVFNKSNEDNRIIYYESSNLLVKIQGRDSKLPGVLISAHYDSVPASFGTTDDGMGVASMLATLKYFATQGKQPLRTMVFNFNNNEEFGLLGAEAFIEHKWFKEVSFFINLEGTGAGGQPILFRGTDKSVLDWYKKVSRPFANSMFQQGFNSGLISSQTDYHVYQKNGLRGIDIAFYKPRSFYHTIKDSIKYTTKGSLWMMISTVLDILKDVSESKDTYDSNLEFSVYFDILNYWYFNFGLDRVLIFNVLLIFVIPLIISILLSIVSSRQTWFVGARGWARFPVTLIACYTISKFAMNQLYDFNPLFVAVNYPYAVVTVFSISTLIGYLILSTAAYLKPIHDQKLVVLFEMNILSWLSLIWISFQINEKNNMGGYTVTIFYILTSLATIWGLLGMIFKRSPCYKKKDSYIVYGSSDNPTTAEENDIENLESEGPGVHNIGEEPVSSGDASNNENSPLLSGESSIVINHENRETFLHNVKHSAINSLQYDWLIQFLILVPISIYFIFSNGVAILDALHQVLQTNKVFDNTIWEFVTIFGVLLSVIILPFIHKLNFLSVQLMALLFFAGMYGFYSTSSYSESSPMTLRFFETFDVNGNSSISNVFGREGHVMDVLTELPTLQKEEIFCVENPSSGTETCSFEGNRPYLLSGTIADNEYEQYLNVTVLSNSNSFLTTESVESLDKFSPLEAILQIDVRGTRQCYLTFNSTNPKFKAPVKMVTIYEEGNAVDENDGQASLFDESSTVIPNGMSRDAHGNWIFKLMKGIDLLQLHKLNWQNADSEMDANDINTFLVKIRWLPFLYDNDVELISNLGINVQCHWSGQDEVVTVDGQYHKKVQDYEDLMMFTDVGVTWSNLYPGIVLGKSYVTI